MARIIITESQYLKIKTLLKELNNKYPRKHYDPDYNLWGFYGIPWDKAAVSARMLKRAFLEAHIDAWPVKWGNRWDIAFGNGGGRVATGLNSLYLWTYREWVDFARKHAPEKSITESMRDYTDNYLYHGTSTSLLDDILRHGIMPPENGYAYWGSERVAEYYAEEAIDEMDGDPVVFKVPLSRFSTYLFSVDHNSVAEPLTYTLEADEEELEKMWEECEGTWQDCLEIYESVRYDGVIHVTMDDIL